MTCRYAWANGRKIQRVMRLIFEPSRLKLYISPSGSITKAMMGLVRVLVSMEPPAPTVMTTIDPSTPTFQLRSGIRPGLLRS
jgi:hypothetical protein